jgi:nucleoside-diphosphate-sugar epimerase
MRRSVQALLDDGEKCRWASHSSPAAPGYFGSVVVRHLRASVDRVRVFDLLDAPDRPADVELVQGDIRSADDVKKALADVDVIHHNVAVVPLAKNKELFWTVNRDGTRVLLDEAQRADVRKIVNVS